MATCKPCFRARVRANREENIERYRAYDRARSDLPHRKEKLREIARRNQEEEDRRLRRNTQCLIWDEANREKRRLISTLNNAITLGHMTRKRCERCGAESANAIHVGMKDPFDVIWLCSKDAGLRRREINAARRLAEALL